jgi:hypothetical protein
MSNRILEGANVSFAFANAQLNGNTQTSTYFSMANYDRIMFVVTTGSENVASSARVRIEAMQGTSTANSTGISMAANVTNVYINTSNASNTIEWRADQMNTNGGYIYAGIYVAETNTNITNVSAVCIRTSARWKQAANAMLG